MEITEKIQILGRNFLLDCVGEVFISQNRFYWLKKHGLLPKKSKKISFIAGIELAMFLRRVWNQRTVPCGNLGAHVKMVVYDNNRSPVRNSRRLVLIGIADNQRKEFDDAWPEAGNAVVEVL